MLSGAMWIDAYNAVTTVAGRYVQGGGCATVGVAGLIQSGGFGSFSKNYGMAAAGLLEAEIVTADGVVQTANACTNPELFWAIKGGGGWQHGRCHQGHAQDARTSRLLWWSQRNDQGCVGYSLPPAGWPVHKLLQRQPL
jgi:FAD/FMN-containing dehydrogenase